MDTQHHPPALVGGAVCELHFTAAGTPSSELLREVTHILEASAPPWRERSRKDAVVHQISSADGIWKFSLYPSHARLKSGSLREPGDFLERVHRLTDVMSRLLDTSLYQVVRLQYLNALPIGGVSAHQLFTRWAFALNETILERGEEFAQSISGIFRGGQYRLRYGVRPIRQEPFYLSDAIVSVNDVKPHELGEALLELGAQGVRLLGLPITDEALRSVEHFAPRGVSLCVDDWLEELWQASPEAEATLLLNNAARVDLLARQYGNEDLSQEDLERLDALTEKVQSLMPRIAERDWQRVQETTVRLNAAEEDVDRIRRKYGLNG